MTKPDLDVSAFVADPCTSLSSDQQRQFQVAEGSNFSNGNYAGCDWKTDPAETLSVHYPNDDRGLSALYEAVKDVGQPALFKSTDIDGYPALYWSWEDSKGAQDCGVAIGIRDDYRIEFTVIRDRKADKACDAALRGATAVLDTIKAAQ